MQLLKTLFVLLASCLLLIAESAGQEANNPTPNNIDNFVNGRFFFGDPCANAFYQFFGITDAKCSLQCYIQAGYQNGGFCDDSNVCQCNEAVTGSG